MAVSARRAKILVKDHSCEIIEGSLTEYSSNTNFVVIGCKLFAATLPLQASAEGAGISGPSSLHPVAEVAPIG